MSRLFILGASDPEMAAIERLLTEYNEPFAYAVGPDGQRVHPGNAYRAERVSDDCPVASLEPGDVVYEVECALRPRIPGVEHVTIDHHRPGDPGYGRPPADYWRGSSIGQLVELLRSLGILGDYNIDAELAFVAAADHCLAAAYRGECPGVAPDALMRWRVETRAAFQQRPDRCRRCGDVRVSPGHWAGVRDMTDEGIEMVGGVSECGDLHEWVSCEEQILEDVESARQQLRDAIAPREAYADLRGRNIPELPEAAAREGIAFLATVRERDGREKIVLQAASPDLVQRFITGELVSGLTDYYGDPARGFAGGYVA